MLFQQVGSTLFKLALVTTQRADELVANNKQRKDEALINYDKAEDMLRQAIRCFLHHIHILHSSLTKWTLISACNWLPLNSYSPILLIPEG